MFQSKSYFKLINTFGNILSHGYICISVPFICKHMPLLWCSVNKNLLIFEWQLHNLNVLKHKFVGLFQTIAYGNIHKSSILWTCPLMSISFSHVYRLMYMCSWVYVANYAAFILLLLILDLPDSIKTAVRDITKFPS